MNRTACFTRKVSYFRVSRICHREKIKFSEVEIRSSSFDLLFFHYTSIFPILQPLGSGYHEIKINELPDRACSGGTIGAN